MNYSNETSRPNCYECKWKAEIPGDAHICCIHPRSRELKVKGNENGIKNGWFYYPFNFDPIWLIECDGFEQK